MSKNINTIKYWGNRFETDWEKFEGPKQSEFFAQLALSIFPNWLINEITKYKYSICDAGCAEGDGANLFYKKFPKSRISAFDFSPIAINKAKNKNPNIDFFVDDLSNLKKTYDIIYCSNTLEHINNQRTVLNNLLKKTNKHLIIQVPFLEKRPIKEHINKFSFNNFPLKIEDFTLTFFKIKDTSLDKPSFWPGFQAIIIYSKNSLINNKYHSYSAISMNDYQKKLKIINDKQVELDNKNKIINQKDDQIIDITNRNYVLNNKLNEIYNSRMWKFLNLYKKTKNILPAIKSKIKTVNLLFRIKKFDQQNTIIYIPTIGWNIPLFQRPQHLALNFTKLGFNFIYGTDDAHNDKIENYSEILPNLLITPKWRKCLETLKNSWVIVASTEMNNDFEYLKNLKNVGHKIIYDYIDEIHSDINGKYTDMILNRHQLILENPEVVDLVLVVSKKLEKQILKYFPKNKVLLISNGVDTEHFNPQKKHVCPKDMSLVTKQNKPIVGYYGALANWLDYDLIHYCCVNRPQYNFVFIGSDIDGKNLKKLPLKLNNFYYLGAKDYELLPNYSAFFNTAIIPFQKGNIAKSASPLKFYEYLSMLIPTVITSDLTECKQYDVSFIASNKKSFCIKMDKALQKQKDKKFMEKMKKIAKNNSWHEKTKIIINKIYEKNN